MKPDDDQEECEDEDLSDEMEDDEGEDIESDEGKGDSDSEDLENDEPSADDDDDSDDDEKPKKKKKKSEPVIKEVPPDAYLIRREATLLSLVLRHFRKRVIVFFNEKIQCHRLMILFKIFKLKAAEVHGNLTQSERMENIEAFQRGDVDYLLATDLVARGLDIPNVKTIINFSFPSEPKRYLHRIGRTARAGAHGVSLTLCNDVERTEIKKLNRKLGH